MTDPIQSISSIHNPLDWSAKTSPKEDLHAADATVASLYYQSTITSLAAPTPEKNQIAAKAESSETKKSFLGQAKDWLWGIFGWGQKQPASPINAENGEPSENESEENLFGGIPKLQEPDYHDHKRLAQTIADLNRELVHRLKDIAEFEEEMKKSSSGKLDKLLFLHLVESSLKQKELNHTRNLLAQEDFFHIHEKNKELQKAHFALIDAITSENKARGVLKWVNVGLTAVTVGGMAVAFALGGPVIPFALPIALLGKSSTLLSDGILKYRSDGKTGELVVIKQETKVNSADKREHLSEMQNGNADIGALMKKIRHLLDNQTKAERASFGRK